VPTIVPSNTACSPGGYGWLNYFDYKTGGAIAGVASVKFDSPIVGINVMYIDGAPVLGVVTADGGVEPPLPPPTKPPKDGFQKQRMIWRVLIQ
jgi:type IV pilus assembly protein PilY1